MGQNTRKWKILIPVLVLAALAAAFWYGGSAPGLQGRPAEQSPAPSAASTPSSPSTPTAVPAAVATPETGDSPVPTAESAAPTITPAASPSPEPTSTGTDPYLTAPVPEGKPTLVEPQDATVSDTAHTCTLSVRCDTVLENLWLDEEKAELVPEDGVIFPETAVTFYEGESVFNLLQRELKKAKIHMEFETTPMYNTAYIEGINNLYQFDCGELSGWMYQVNGWFPNYGCSRYQLQDGDVVEWVYSCDSGRDVGGSNAVGS